MLDNCIVKSLRAGVAKIDISVSGEIARVNDPLFAKVLIFKDGEQEVAIFALDAVAIGGICDISDGFMNSIRSELFSRYGFPGENIIINATHTHTAGPMLCEEKELLSRLVMAFDEALTNMRYVKIGCGKGYDDTFAINRTLRLKNGLHWSIRQANPCPPDDMLDELGIIDPEIGILKIEDTCSNLIAVLYTFSCHPLLGVSDGSVTGNYPGFASKLIEDMTGATAIFLQGALGDVTEILYKDFNRPSDSSPVGTSLGINTLKALKDIKCDYSKINCTMEKIRLPRRDDIPEKIELLINEQEKLLESLRGTSLNFKSFLPLYIKYTLDPLYPSDYSYRYIHEEIRGKNDLKALDLNNRKRIDKYLKNISTMEKLARIQDKIATLKRHYKINEDANETHVDAEVIGLKIGDFVIITCPAEALVQIALNVKKMSPFEFTYLVSPTNGYVHYGAPASYYDKGGYEVTECLLSEKWQITYEECTGRILRKLF